MSLHAYDVDVVYSIFKQEQGNNNFTPPRYRGVAGVFWMFPGLNKNPTSKMEESTVPTSILYTQELNVK